MSEQFANKITTTVASAYTAGSGTVVVASATGMPATGNFRLRLGNTAGSILICTSRAGTTLTVSVEQDDGNAAIGDTVQLVGTAGAMAALKADAIAGAGGGWPGPFTPLDQSGWSWVNQGGAVVAQAGNIVYLEGPAQTGRNDRLRVTTAPATPYTITAAVILNFVLGTSWAGIAFRESGTGKIIHLNQVVASRNLEVIRDTNATTFSAVNASVAVGLTNAQLVWLRIRDDGTNLIFSYSYDGVNFIQLNSQGRTAFMAGGPNQVGIFVATDTAGAIQKMSVLSWVVS